MIAGLMPALVLACGLGISDPVRESISDHGDAVARERESISDHGDAVARERESVSDYGDAVVRERESVSDHGDAVAREQENALDYEDTGALGQEELPAIQAACEIEQAPQIALTFDDGPHPVYTARLLDGLKERGVSATFFVLGENIEGNEALLERMTREGHLIGNHTYHHVKLSSLQHDAAVEEIEETSALVEAVTGQGTEFIRPPFGIWNKTLEYDVVMLPALWDIDTLDWTTKNVPVTVGKVMDDAADQDIILFHDCYASSVEAALQVVDLLLEQGYEFVTVDQVILPP